MTHSKEKKMDKNYPWGGPSIGIIDENFKTAALNTLKELKENMDK